MVEEFIPLNCSLLMFRCRVTLQRLVCWEWERTQPAIIIGVRNTWGWGLEKSPQVQTVSDKQQGAIVGSSGHQSEMANGRRLSRLYFIQNMVESLKNKVSWSSLITAVSSRDDFCGRRLNVSAG